jgi:hypothetical protein
VHALALALLLAADPAQPAAPAPADPVERQRADIARRLLRLGKEIEREILAEDVAALAARVPAGGLRCADRLVPRARVERDLRSPSSWLHGVFFGGPGYDAPRGEPASLAALLRTGREIAVVVTFRPDERAGPAGLPCLDFRAKGMATPGAPLCFEEKGGRLWFVDSLYPCG